MDERGFVACRMRMESPFIDRPITRHKLPKDPSRKQAEQDSGEEEEFEGFLTPQYRYEKLSFTKTC